MSSAASIKQVTICGGGNGAHVAAGYLASKGVKVNVLTRRPEAWSDVITVDPKGSSWESRGVYEGRLNKVSSDPAELVPGSDVVIIAAPANAHPALLEAVAPHVTPSMALGALFAQGGFDWAAAKALDRRFDRVRVVFGLQNIPWICKAVEYGRRAIIIGPKKVLYAAASPVEKTPEACAICAELFDIPCQPLPNFLALTLTPSNQIIHPARYFGIFHDWDGKRTYTMEELAARKGLTLYADMDELSAELLSKLDNELQQVKLGLVARFPDLDLDSVLPIGERIVKQYGDDVSDTSSLRKIFATNLGYAGCKTPLKEVAPGQFQPVVASRLFWEDIPFGLCILKSLALSMQLPTPSIDFFIRWHQQFMGKTFLLPDGTLNPETVPETAAPEAYGLVTLDAVVAPSLPSARL